MEKVRYQCPECEKVYKVPAKIASLPRCRPCQVDRDKMHQFAEQQRLEAERIAEEKRIEAETLAEEERLVALAERIEAKEQRLAAEDLTRRTNQLRWMMVTAAWAPDPQPKEVEVPEYIALKGYASICHTVGMLLILLAIILGGMCAIAVNTGELQTAGLMFTAALSCAISAGGCLIGSEFVLAFRDLCQNSFRRH